MKNIDRNISFRQTKRCIGSIFKIEELTDEHGNIRGFIMGIELVSRPLLKLGICEVRQKDA